MLSFNMRKLIVRSSLITAPHENGNTLMAREKERESHRRGRWQTFAVPVFHLACLSIQPEKSSAGT
jgi:hypothetical protein